MPEWFCLIYSTPVFSSFSPNTKEHPLNSLGFTRSCLSICCFSPHVLSFPGDSVGILLPMQETQETWVSSLVFPPGKIPWRRAWWPLQYSCLKNPIDRGAWRATVHRLQRVRLSDWAHRIYTAHIYWPPSSQTLPTSGHGGYTLIFPHLLSFFPRLLLLLCHLLYILFYSQL